MRVRVIEDPYAEESGNSIVGLEGEVCGFMKAGDYECVDVAFRVEDCPEAEQEVARLNGDEFVYIHFAGRCLQILEE